MVVGLGADPSRRANPALSPAYKAEPHADAADRKAGTTGNDYPQQGSTPTYDSEHPVICPTEIGSESEIRTLGFLGVGEALWPLS